MVRELVILQNIKKLREKTVKSAQERVILLEGLVFQAENFLSENTLNLILVLIKQDELGLKLDIKFFVKV